MSKPPEVSEPLAAVIKRRMVGLLVLVLLGFAASFILRGKTGGRADTASENPELKTTIVPIGGSTAAESAAESSRKP